MINLVPYNKAWADEFLQEKIQLERALNNVVAIEHIGSTAIPGIYAKPVIDILIGINDLAKFNNDNIKSIESLGYSYIKDYEKELPFRRFFKKNSDDGQRTHHIHLVNYRSSFWQRHILFRDYLRKNSEQAKVYESLKLSLAEQFTDSNEYAKAKTTCVRDLGNQAYYDFPLNKPFFITERLMGFIPQTAVFDDLVAMMQDETFLACYGVKFNKDEIYGRIIEDMNHWDQYGFGPLMWFDKLTRKFIGRGGLRSRIIEEKPEVELAYAMIPEAWGKGLAIEMSLPSLQFAFGTLNLANIICFTQTKNVQSLAVMQKIGFLYEKDFTYFNLPHKLYRLKNTRNAIVIP